MVAETKLWNKLFTNFALGNANLGLVEIFGNLFLDYYLPIMKKFLQYLNLSFIPTLLSVRFEVGVSFLLAPAGADKRGPKAPFPLVENAGPAGGPAGAGAY